jgi:hypothetical protein
VRPTLYFGKTPYNEASRLPCTRVQQRKRDAESRQEWAANGTGPFRLRIRREGDVAEGYIPSWGVGEPELRGMLPLLDKLEPAVDAQFSFGTVISSGAGYYWLDVVDMYTTKAVRHRWLNIVVAWQEVQIECCWTRLIEV